MLSLTCTRAKRLTIDVSAPAERKGREEKGEINNSFSIVT
jgi:hypothetical protein